MKKILIFSLVALIIAAAGFWFIYIQGQRPLARFKESVFSQDSISNELSTDQSEVPLQLTEVARGLFVPWSIVFTAPNRMLVTERSGTVRAIVDGQLQSEPIYSFSAVSTTGEEGLMGMTLDPEYAENGFLYFSFAYSDDATLFDKVVRLTDQGDSLSDEVTVIDRIPAARNHAGSRLKFGPDKKLYITTGDATQKNLAQDTNSLAGKILRVNADGTIPADNPFLDSPVYSFGHRNSQGLDWHPLSGTLYETEHGPSGNDGPGGGDEVNVVIAGGNYGWPLVSHTTNKPGLIGSELVYTPAVAPASGTFYRSQLIPQFTNNFLFGALRGEGVYLVKIDQNDPTQTLGSKKLTEVMVGRVREVVEGPDGAVYISTSNRDGRGKASDGDDKIYRLAPVNR